MPTISIYHKDFEQLVGREVTIEDIETWLSLVKGELKDHTPATGEIRVELQDSNRPDLWGIEGIARQIRMALSDAMPSSYAFFSSRARPKRRVMVSAGMEQVRPFLAAACASGYAVTADGLTQLIQAQEKLADIFGRKRSTISIGLYRLEAIQFPVTYGLVQPHAASFVPLGFEEKLTLQDILSVHPKGMEYGHILEGQESLPLLWDKEGQVLSFPPIINSRDVGQVQVGDSQLLIEVTGTDLRMVILALNIFAVNLADRGATIDPVEVLYPYATEFGKTIRMPFDFSSPQRVPLHAIESALGLPLGTDVIKQALTAYGYEVKASRHQLSVRLPPYRNDLLHAVDVAEDVAISRGYESFAPEMPVQFTVGSLSPLEETSDLIRDYMVGCGFQEMFSNILMAREDLVDRMKLTDPNEGHVVEVDNVMSQHYSCLRSWIIPSLLQIESASNRAFYPHRLFEVGEVAIPDLSQELGSQTLVRLGALVANPAANFSEVHTYLDLLLYYFVRPYTLEPMQHHSFMPGRVGKILSQERTLGFIGELHPEVLEAWQISMPVAVFELDVGELTREG
ncbi:MAG: phenylalanine--tRNA ligase subunit beta [Nitrospirales bacterium]|nr:phenylalanine--tRNA ligase subunit beta [Nitrospirales bacterium]